jgi:hypothetical protein
VSFNPVTTPCTVRLRFNSWLVVGYVRSFSLRICILFIISPPVQ